jgi:hypothetical protein
MYVACMCVCYHAPRCPRYCAPPRCFTTKANLRHASSCEMCVCARARIIWQHRGRSCPRVLSMVLPVVSFGARNRMYSYDDFYLSSSATLRQNIFPLHESRALYNMSTQIWPHYGIYTSAVLARVHAALHPAPHVQADPTSPPSSPAPIRYLSCR